MATITSNSTVVVISAGSKFFVFDGETELLNGKMNKAIDVTEISNSLPVVTTVREDEDSKSKKKQIADKVEIYSSAFSRDGTLFCVVTSAKTSLIYESEDFSLVRAFRIAKTPTAVVFDSDGSHVVISDRAGNVTRYCSSSSSVSGDKPRLDINGEETNYEGEPLTGAISIILDVAISECGKYVISGDRDEKVRISCYPQSYVIQSYALGHTAYVGTVSVLGNNVYTSGGDATVRKFNLDDGTLLQSSPKLSEEQPVRRIRSLQLNEDELVAVSIDKTNRLVLLSGKDLTPKMNFDLTSPAIDFIVKDGKALVLNSSGVLVLDLSTQQSSDVTFEDSDLKENLSNAKDPMPSYYKTISHQNIVDYQERKAKKLEKVAEEKERKAAKRKADKENGSEAVETKKVEVSA